MTTSDAQKEIQKVDSATIESPLKPMEHNRGPFAQGWWFVRRYPVIPIAVLIILVITAIIGPTVAPYERDVGIIGDRHLPILQRSKCIQTDQWLSLIHISEPTRPY